MSWLYEGWILPGRPHLARRTVRLLNQSLAQKPNGKAAVMGWECLYITIFTEYVAMHVPTPNLEGQDTVRQTSTHGPTWYERLCECLTDIPQYSSMGLRGIQTATPRQVQVSSATKVSACLIG
ncbi:hypothetical protein T265_00474 [Opisthorchis viverrini]|uniref:Uncharacterized protein n=1 Tax=Opisthorchis viverrini TaxID=6198 RepID=A0A075A373_OPIVI|nr:hypothetical protein T265_00474 [Opisthorchis viverrini]KER33811.1 hypothetical protein T265_00474 [Opisthorchis viverrini]